jgi:hypothetical protein
MKIWMKRCVVGLLLVGFVTSAPLMIGCQSKQEKNKAAKDFQADNLDPTNVKMKPLPGPGGTEAPKQ